MAQLVRTFESPPTPPEPGRHYYLPDEYYFVDSGQVSIKDFLRITAQCVGQWADHYLAGMVGVLQKQQSGPLPLGTDERAAMIDRLVDWIVQLSNGVPHNQVLSLSAGEVSLWDQHDGVPGVLDLTRAQFEALQACWMRNALPADLYYPAMAQRSAVDVVELFGGLVRVRQRYSPRRWMNRIRDPAAEPAVPSEEERRERFRRDCWQFHEALMRRYMELSEPGKPKDKELATRFLRLDREVRELDRQAPISEEDGSTPHADSPVPFRGSPEDTS